MASLLYDFVIPIAAILYFFMAAICVAMKSKSTEIRLCNIASCILHFGDLEHACYYAFIVHLPQIASGELFPTEPVALCNRTVLNLSLLSFSLSSWPDLSDGCLMSYRMSFLFFCYPLSMKMQSNIQILINTDCQELSDQTYALSGI